MEAKKGKILKWVKNKGKDISFLYASLLIKFNIYTNVPYKFKFKQIGINIVNLRNINKIGLIVSTKF